MTLRAKSILFGFGLLSLLTASHPALALIAGGYIKTCIGNDCGNAGADFSEGLTLYLSRQLVLIIFFYIAGYILGRRVEQGKISVNVSRKIICLLTFVISYANSLSIPVIDTSFTLMLVFGSVSTVLLLLASLTAPLRQRFKFLKIVFTAINRPEDAPHTIVWMATEAVATAAVIMAAVPVIGYFASQRAIDDRVLTGLMLIPVFASGIGDALAEIVGKKWGRHAYTTRAFFGGRRYTRTYEGSAMVFITTIVTGVCVAFMFSFQLPAFFWKSFILLPFTLTLAEALAPHTWDNPILYLVGYATIILCMM